MAGSILRLARPLISLLQGVMGSTIQYSSQRHFPIYRNITDDRIRRKKERRIFSQSCEWQWWGREGVYKLTTYPVPDFFSNYVIIFLDPKGSRKFNLGTDRTVQMIIKTINLYTKVKFSINQAWNDHLDSRAQKKPFKSQLIVQSNDTFFITIKLCHNLLYEYGTHKLFS